MPGAVVELFPSSILSVLSAFLVSDPLQQQHMIPSLETPHPGEKVKGFNVLGLSKKG